MTTSVDHAIEAEVVWARVEDGFHVGSRDGDFIGYVDRQDDGSYLACDLYSREVGRFPTRSAAMAALSADGRAPDTADSASTPEGR